MPLSLLRGSLLLTGFLILCSTSGLLWGQEDAPPAEKKTAEPQDELDALLNLAETDVGRLSEIKVRNDTPFNEAVSTVNRTPSTVAKSSAAVYVITNEMIRRSAAQNIPEVLRLAPGVNVARVDGNKYAISIRGFNGELANKLLIQIDGRSVYTPLFGGTYWDVQDVVLEDVERIEIIRGPGATAWGANAVNGVINVITKSSAETQGTYIQSGGGTFERAFSTVRYGGKINEDTTFRIYGKWFERGPSDSITNPAADDWRQARTGFRLDYDPDQSHKDILTWQGDIYDGLSGTTTQYPTSTAPFFQTQNFDQQVNGGNSILRWTHTFDDDSVLRMQG